MNKEISRFLRSAMVYTILSFLPAGLGLILTPLFTNHFATTSEFGLLTLANFFFAFFAVLIGLGFDSAYSVMYFHYNKDSASQKSLLHTIFLLITASFILFFAVLHVGGDFLFKIFVGNQSFSYTQFGQYAILMGMATVLNAITLAFYRNENNLKLFAIQSIIIAILPMVAQVICLFYVSNTAQAVVKARSITTILVAGLFAFLFFVKDGVLFRKSFMRPLFRLSIPFAMYGLIIFLFENIDRPIIERGFADLHLLSVYGLAITFVAIAELLRVSVASALSPAIFQIMAEDNEPAKVNQLYRLFLWISYVFICLLLLIIQPLFLFFIKNKDFFQALDFIPFLMLCMIPKLYYSVYQLPLTYYSRIKLLPVFNLLSLLFGLLVFFLTRNYLHIYSVMLSIFMSRSLQAVITLSFLKRNGSIYRKEEFLFSNERSLILVTSASIIGTYILYRNGYLPFFMIGLISVAILLIKGVKSYSWFFGNLKNQKKPIAITLQKDISVTNLD